MFFFFFQAKDGIRVVAVTGVQTCALPISKSITYRPAARAPPGAEPASGRPVRDRLRPGSDGARRRAPGVDGAARVGRLGALERGLLRAAHQRRGLDARGPVAHLHPAHRRRGGVSHPEERAGAAPDLASAGGPSRGAHPGLLPRLCALENARAVAATRWARAQPAHRPRGAAADSEHRRRASDRRRARDSTALRGASGRPAGRAPRSPRSRASRTPADPAPATRTRSDVVPTFLVSARKVASDPLELRKLG